ncbi:MAG: glycosyltransferase family 2 protein [Deltaproteobacteria bacterium]|nr:glycosyltransferase family 2 protein [Deltaproteobacteria bacterium]
MDQKFDISIIIPVHNGSRYLEKCLSSIKRSSYGPYETIVVDDGSTDGSAEIAGSHGAIVFKLPHQSGPAAARNFGSKQAKGNILFFVDSDIVIRKETVARVVDGFDKNPDVVAIFGSYDESPEEQDFFSQFKNLQHHYVHQSSRAEAVTFWAGCGAIRKEIFDRIGGFDEERYSRPCIEDIELGFRLKRMGYRILLDKELQVKHLKKWTLRSLLRSDILDRAIPWSKLILESREKVSDLNLQPSQKVSTLLVGLAVVISLPAIYTPKLILVVLFLLASILMINYRLFMFLLRRKGPVFSFLAFVMYLLYYFYSGVTYASCWLAHKLRN